MSKKVTVRALALLAGGALCFTAIPLSACGGGKGDSIVVMSEEFSGLFNPFYATSGADMNVVSLTQLSMLTTDSNGNIVAGKDEATAVLDYEVKSEGENSVYYFVLKNGLKFSDGEPLTMNDVMFNIYEYLDPVYTGSSTLYSTKIQGLSKYRTQEDRSDDNGETESSISASAYSMAGRRRTELSDLFKDASDANHNTSVSSSGNNSYYAEPDEMREAIKTYNVSSSYQEVVLIQKENGEAPTTEDYRKKLLADYELVLENFEKELNDDFGAAQDAFDLKTAPYDKHKDKFASDVFKFLYYEGLITPNYGTNPDTNKKDPSIIDSFNSPDISKITTKEAAVKFAFDRMIADDFLIVLSSTVTAAKIMTEFSSEAKQLILLENASGGLRYPRVEGIVSLGHKVDDAYVLGTETTVKVNDKDYKIAKQHNADGTPTNAHGTPTNVDDNDEYDILRVTLNGKDPKAIYNFAFAVAPVHIYSNIEVDIEHDKFGVDYSSASFQSKVIQSDRNTSVPVGAGPYKASDKNNGDDPSGAGFKNSNFIFYKRNDHFIFPVKTEKFRYQYVSSTNAIDKLKAKEIDFVTPAFTKENSQTVLSMEKDGFKSLYAWQLGYGYIGINAGKVPNLNVRKAIMSAMNPNLATEFYETNTCQVIYWPMSNQSWAYPTTDGGIAEANGHDYATWLNERTALTRIRDYTNAAISNGVQSLKFKFTIAGSSLTEHPTYNVFRRAVELLNEANREYNFSVQWDVEVVADSQALTKLSTGSLAVWAAAWGSTIDPDMYQVYHKNSTATSVYSWGYREILDDQDTYRTEYGIIANQLSPVIDEARSIDDSTEAGRNERKRLYKKAMGYVLDLAVELPVYQRKNLYAYNAKKLGGVIDQDHINPFTSPLERVWELEILK